jgi:DNA-binding transcriptional ArsR family regulator
MERGVQDPELVELDPGFEPAEMRLIGDVETLRVISDPTRLRLLETMVQRQDPAWSVKELASELGVPQTRLYHHVDLLLGHGLIRPVERRIVSGIIETRYRVAARSFQLDRRLLTGDSAGREALHDTLVAVFDTARDEIEQAIRLGSVDLAQEAPEDKRILLSRGVARLSPDRLAELRRRLNELEQEFAEDHEPTGLPFGIVLAVYPLPPATGEPGEADTPSATAPAGGPPADHAG